MNTVVKLLISKGHGETLGKRSRDDVNLSRSSHLFVNERLKSHRSQNAVEFLELGDVTKAIISESH